MLLSDIRLKDKWFHFASLSSSLERKNNDLTKRTMPSDTLSFSLKSGPEYRRRKPGGYITSGLVVSRKASLFRIEE
jgi:hypothetical protein